MFVYLHEMRSRRMKWLDFAQVNTYIKERDKSRRGGGGALHIYCCFFDLRWCFLIHLLFLILSCAASQPVWAYFCHPTCSLLRHVQILLRVMPWVCLVTSFIQGAFIYSCHFLILIIEHGEMFLLYSYKALAKECWHLWKYGSTAFLFFFLHGTDNPPCKARVLAVGRRCNAYRLKLSLTSRAARGTLRCRLRRQRGSFSTFLFFL